MNVVVLTYRGDYEAVEFHGVFSSDEMADLAIEHLVFEEDKQRIYFRKTTADIDSWQAVSL